MALEKLGVEKQQLKEELQSDYNRLVQQQHTLNKEASASGPQRAALANEIDQIKTKLNELQQD